MLGDEFDHQWEIEGNYFSSFRHSLIELIKTILKIHLSDNIKNVSTNIGGYDVPNIEGSEDAKREVG